MSWGKQPHSTRNSVMSSPGVILPMLLWKVPPVSGSGLGVKKSRPSVNQRFPSEPTVMDDGSLSALGTLYVLYLNRAGAACAPESVPPTRAAPTERRHDPVVNAETWDPLVVPSHPGTG